MSAVRAACIDCGEVEMTTRDVTVLICTDDNRGSYRFRCPKCHMTMVKSAESRTIDLLIAAGCSMSTWNLPAELGEPRQGPPITYDDLLDAHIVLTDEAQFMEAIAVLNGS